MKKVVVSLLAGVTFLLGSTTAMAYYGDGALILASGGQAGAAALGISVGTATAVGVTGLAGVTALGVKVISKPQKGQFSVTTTTKK